MTVTLTRGERDCDPGNMNFIPLSRAFDGELRVETLPDGHPGRFGVYDSMFHGARAAAEEVLIKVLKQGLVTPNALIGDPRNGWAPMSDGNHPASYVSRTLGYANNALHLTGSSAITPTSNITELVKHPVSLEAITGGMFVVENGRFPVGLTPQDHLAACISALTAQNIKWKGQS